MLLKRFVCEFSFVLVCSGILAQEAGNGPFVMPAISDPIFTHEGHFLTEGTNSLENLELRQWAEDVAVRVARTVGAELPHGEARVIRITINNDDPVSSGRVMAEEGMEKGVFVRRLKIYNYEKIGRSEANEALCKSLLGGYVAYRHPKPVDSVDEVSSAAYMGTNSLSLPGWFYRGMSRYIYQDMRAVDVDAVLRVWKNGRLKPFPEFLNGVEVEKDYPYAPVYTIIVAWIESLPDRHEIFSKMFDQLASGGALSPDWFAKNIPGCHSVSDVDEQWENWIIKQWRVVHRLGVATALQVEQLKERLVLQQGDVGIPLSPNSTRRITFKSLTEMKSDEWLQAVLKSKIWELRLLGMGKGRNFNDVVDAYCRFLDAVSAGKRASYVKDLLDKADKNLEELEAKVAESGSTGDDK